MKAKKVEVEKVSKAELKADGKVSVASDIAQMVRGLKGTLFPTRKGRLDMRVEMYKNGHLLAKMDLPYDEEGIAFLIRQREDRAKTKVGRERIIRLP